MRRLYFGAAAVLAALVGAGLAPSSAAAQHLQALCADRPGMGTPTCTVDAGHFQAEAGFGVERDDTADARTDTFSAAALALRLGLTDSFEAQLQWTPWVNVRVHDKVAGAESTTRGAGDLTLAVRQSFEGGRGTSWAIQPFITAPTGATGISDDAWSGGVVLPMSMELDDTYSLSLTTEVAVVGDADGAGHHLAFAGVVGLGRSFGPVSMALEAAFAADEAAGSPTQTWAGLSAAWSPPGQPSLQFDAGINAGLNADTPDAEVYVGLVRRF